MWLDLIGWDACSAKLDDSIGLTLMVWIFHALIASCNSLELVWLLFFKSTKKGFLNYIIKLATNRIKRVIGTNRKGCDRYTPHELLVGRARFELATNGLKVRCSTDWATVPFSWCLMRLTNGWDAYVGFFAVRTDYCVILHLANSKL